MAQREKVVVFLGGTGYSGSTLLDLILSNRTDAFSCGELFALFRPFRMHHFHAQCDCGNGACTIWKTIKGFGERHVYEHIFDHFTGIDTIIDSSKSPFWIKDQLGYLNQTPVRAVNLLIWKRPEEFAYSLHKRGKSNDWARNWITYHKRYFDAVGSWTSVGYHDLALDPQKVIEGISRRLQLPYHQGMEQFWEKERHVLFGNQATRLHLHNKDSDTFKKGAAVLAREKQNDAAFDGEKQHRSIYYEDKRLDALKPKPAQQEDIARILEILSKSDFRKGASGDFSTVRDAGLKKMAGWYVRDKGKNVFRKHLCQWRRMSGKRLTPS